MEVSDLKMITTRALGLDRNMFQLDRIGALFGVQDLACTKKRLAQPTLKETRFYVSGLNSRPLRQI